MAKRILQYSLLTFIGLSIISCKKEVTNTEKITTNKPEKPQPIFELVEQEHSKLVFNNRITHDLSSKSNLFDYDFFYNGAGVGVEDLNNDGLKDIVFASNQTENKIFINKGNLQFEDITKKSGINTNKNWSNGITFVDINGDNFMDIYISQGGPYSREKRKNLLYINNGDLTFTESAEKYGLADTGISTQSVFMDFDKDGDLDCFVMNESELYGYEPKTYYKLNSNQNIIENNTCNFYINQKGKFIKSTKKTGVQNPSFGLGLIASDINNDGWVDIYVANDYYVPDAMYINNKKGRFIDNIKKTTKQVSFYGMGIDMGDLNNDDLDEIFVLDMAAQDHVRSKTLMASMNVPMFDLLDNLGLQTQYMYNSLQLNLGNNQYHNISQQLKLAKTDWSWAGLIQDFNNDSNEDIYVTNGYRRYALDNDKRTEIAKAKRKYNGNVPLSVKEEIYNSLPSEKLSNVFFLNQGNLKIKNHTTKSGLFKPSFSNGAAYADFDNDGDFDLVINNIDSNCFLYKNLTTETKKNNFIKIKTTSTLSEGFPKVTVCFNGVKKTKEVKRVRGYLSAVDTDVIFGLGDQTSVDTLTITWPSGKSIQKINIEANNTYTFTESDASLNSLKNPDSDQLFSLTDNKVSFTHKENSFNDFNKEVLLPYKQSTLGPLISKGDLNGDGKKDLFIGGAKGQSGKIFYQTEKGYKEVVSPALSEDSHYEDMEALFIDIDADKDNDLIVVSGGNDFKKGDNNLVDRIYINDGKGSLTRQKSEPFFKFRNSGKSITKIDFDKDGDQDIIIGNRIIPQTYPVAAPSFIFENINGKFKNVTGKICSPLLDFGIINKVVTTDINNDGWEDFITVGEWSHIGVFINNKGVFTDVSHKSRLDQLKGWWHTVIPTDINNDGLVDLLVGNIGTNTKYKSSKDKPLKIYADDFDSNGSHDVVLSYKYNNTYVPFRGKECSTQQMPFISKKIPTYQQFANSSLYDIYGDKLNSAYHKEATSFKSYILINKGDSTFKQIELPPLAQAMPILDGVELDVNKDGFKDLVIVGNIYNTEVETPRLDNNFGLVLLSNQKDNYKVLGPNKTGLYLEGNCKSLEIIGSTNKQLLFSFNNGPTKVYNLN